VGPEVKEAVSGGLAGRIQGKMKNGALVGATLKTVGGSAAAITDSGSIVGGIN
jgi:hypothetical protein